MAQDGVVALGVVLHGGEERQTCQLGQASALYSRPKAEGAEFPEALPVRHALVLFQGVVPCLCSALHVIGREPGALRSHRLLSSEELLTLVQPIERVNGAIIRGELEFVELGSSLGAEDCGLIRCCGCPGEGGVDPPGEDLRHC